VNLSDNSVFPINDMIKFKDVNDDVYDINDIEFQSSYFDHDEHLFIKNVNELNTKARNEWLCAIKLKIKIIN
jgi:hypothetical protein